MIVLCRTSNPASDWIQGVRVGEDPLYLTVAKQVGDWDLNDQCMLVTGATYPEELGEVREAVGDMPLLVPGVGAQGGDVEAVLKAGVDSSGQGLCISSSRGIIYAGSGRDFAEKAGQSAMRLRDEINRYR